MSAPFMAAPPSGCGAAAAPTTAARGGFMAIDIGGSLRSVRASGLYRGSGREATMRIRALQHVSIRSRDPDRSRDFYERSPGLLVARLRPAAARVLIAGLGPAGGCALVRRLAPATARPLIAARLPALGYGGGPALRRARGGDVALDRVQGRRGVPGARPAERR